MASSSPVLGHGKTETLSALIASLLKQDDPPGMVILDSTGAIIKRMQRLAVFDGRLRNRIIIIDPEHHPPPALNMFDISTSQFNGYSLAQRAAVQVELVELFKYIFSSIDNPLTDPMKTALSYIVRLLLTVPGANVHTLRNILEENVKSYEASRYRSYIDELDAGQIKSSSRDFFKKQFFTERVSGTKASVLQRLSSIVGNPAIERMFTSSNAIDFFDEMNKKSIILVNTNENILKESSTLFGRYIVARCMAAAFERAPIAFNDRKPVLLIVDEALPYFDETFEKLWTRVRQYKLGVFTAFQHLKGMDEGLKGALASSTSVKTIGGLGYDDSRWVAREMRTTPEFLQAQTRDPAEPPQWTQYACYVGNLDSARRIASGAVLCPSRYAPDHVASLSRPSSTQPRAGLIVRISKEVRATVKSERRVDGREAEAGGGDKETSRAAVRRSGVAPRSGRVVSHGRRRRVALAMI